MRRPSITTPHSRISKRRRDVSPGRQLHEEEFGALPLTSVPKHATLSSRAGFLPLPPTRIASFGTGISRWDTTFPPRPPSTWAFPNPAAKIQEFGARIPCPDTKFPNLENAPQRFPSSPNPQIGMWCQGPAPSNHKPLQRQLWVDVLVVEDAALPHAPRADQPRGHCEQCEDHDGAQ